MKDNVKSKQTPPKMVSFEIPPSLYRRLRRRSEDMGRTMSGHLRKLVKDDLEPAESRS